MGIPAKYMEIKDFIAGYINMYKILAKFENNNPDKIKGSLAEDKNNWVIIISDKCLYTNNYYKAIYTYAIYLNKHKEEIILNCKIKSTYNNATNNYLFGELIKQLKSKKINKTKLILEKDKSNMINLKIELNIEMSYVDQINKILDIITKYNDVMFDKLCDNWFDIQEKERNKQIDKFDY